MNTLNLENITNQAPYQITLVEVEPCIFYFQTDYEVEYEIVGQRIFGNSSYKSKKM